MKCGECEYYSYERVKNNKHYKAPQREGRCGKFDAYSVSRSLESGCSMGKAKK